MIKSTLHFKKGGAAQTKSLLQSALVQAPVRGYIPYYQKKYDDYFKPRYYDNPRRQP